jgi:hypothetical protein
VAYDAVIRAHAQYTRRIGPVSNGNVDVRSVTDVREPHGAAPGLRQCVLETQEECYAWDACLVAVVFLGARRTSPPPIPVNDSDPVHFPALASSG